MDLKVLSEIEKKLKQVECKSYSIEIKYDDNNRVFIEKKPPENERKIGFNQ